MRFVVALAVFYVAMVAVFWLTDYVEHRLRTARMLRFDKKGR